MLPSKDDDFTDEIYYPLNAVGPSDELEREIEFIRKQQQQQQPNYFTNEIDQQRPYHANNRRVVLPNYYGNVMNPYAAGEFYETEEEPVYGTVKKTYKPEKKTSSPRRITDDGDVYLRSRRRSYKEAKGIDALRELMKKNKR